MSKKLKIVKQDDKGAELNLSQTTATNPSADIEIVDQDQLQGSDLFSFFTANIIKEGKVFTR